MKKSSTFLGFPTNRLFFTLIVLLSIMTNKSLSGGIFITYQPGDEDDIFGAFMTRLILLALVAIILQIFFEIAKTWFNALRDPLTQTFNQIWHGIRSPECWKRLVKAAVTPPESFFKS